MKTVFDNSMVAHIWAQRNQPEGRSPSGNFYFKDSTLWSYGSHFAVGRFVGAGVVLLTCRSYSISTSRHISYARQAIPRHYTALYCPYPDKDAAGNRDWYASQITAHVDAVNAMRPGEKVRRAKRMALAASAARDFNDYLAALPESERGKAQPFALDMDQYAAGVAKLRAKEKRAELLRAKREREEAAERVRKWLAGDPDVRLYGYRNENGGALLRVSGDMVQTSQGAEVPAADVRVGLRKWRYCVDHNANWARNGEQIALGHFQLDAINGNTGEVRAGCHTIYRPELEKIEQLLMR